MKKARNFLLDRKDWQAILALLIAFLMVVAAHFLAMQVLEEYEESTIVVQRAYDCNDLLRSLDRHLVEVESSVRSYVIVGDSLFAEAAENEMRQVKDDIVEVRHYFESSSQEAILDELEELVDEKIRFSKNVLDDYQEEGKLEAVEMISSGEGLQLREGITAITNALRNYQKEELRHYFQDKKKASDELRTISWIRMLTVLLVIVFSLIYFVKTSRRRKEVEKLKEQHHFELQQNINFIKDLYDNAPIGYHTLDPDGTIQEVNQTELDWLGYTKEEVFGKRRIFDLMWSPSQDLRKDFISRLQQTGKADGVLATLVRKDGTTMQVIINNRAVLDNDGNLVQVRGAVMDFTERKKLEEELEKARASAERSALLKEQFVANMSHEIRTPLNAILGFSGLLQKTALRGEQEEFTSNIKMSSENLLAIINDILDFSKIEAGALRIESIPFSIPNLLHSLENMFRFKANEKNLVFRVEMNEDVPKAVMGDPTRLNQILVNLLGNAFKFTDEGKVEVRVSKLGEKEGKTLLRFLVKDTGIGIPPNKSETIFERFGQASSDTTRRYGGAGLGLTISKQLAELQGGSIRVEGLGGRGAVFIVEIPYEVTKSEKIPSSRATVEAPLNSNSGRILIVEDNPMNLRIAELLVDGWGFDYDHAINGKIAVDMLRKQVFDLVLMDIQMPVMDGYTATRIIRQELHLDVPIIAVTAHAFAGEREKCLSYGMTDYLSKPLKEEELRLLIDRYVGRAKVSSKNGIRQQAGKTLYEKFDQQYVLDISKGKTEILKEMSSLFIKQSSKEMDQIEEAIREKNYSVVSNAAHSMRSTVGYMGLETFLGSELKQLEAESKKIHPNPKSLEKMAQKIKKLRLEAASFLEDSYLK